MKGEPLESQPECYYRVKERHEGLGEYGPGAVAERDGRLVPGKRWGRPGSWRDAGIWGRWKCGDRRSSRTGTGKGGRFTLAGAWKGIIGTTGWHRRAG